LINFHNNPLFKDFALLEQKKEFLFFQVNFFLSLSYCFYSCLLPSNFNGNCSLQESNITLFLGSYLLIRRQIL